MNKLHSQKLGDEVPLYKKFQTLTCTTDPKLPFALAQNTSESTPSLATFIPFIPFNPKISIRNSPFKCDIHFP